MIVHHLNSCDIYHRDLKPENFLIRTDENGRIYLHLNDFGLAKNTKADYSRPTSTMGRIKGTIEYVAPEILNAALAKPNISKQDVWSIGVIAYQLCTLRLPFKAEQPAATMMAILNNPYNPIPHNLYSEELKDIINRLLTKDPEQRPSIQELTIVQVIRNALDNLLKEFDGKIHSELRNSLLLKELPVKPGDIVHAHGFVSYIDEGPFDISLIEIPDGESYVHFVYLSCGRLYTESDETLYVYSLDDLTSPSATYPLGESINSGLITDNRLYLGGDKKLHIFEVTPSLTEPLTPVTQIPTERGTYKVLRVGDDLLLGS
jgi:serine/threonine protein kinase